MKLLVNAPSGQQEIIEVGEGGGYFDSTLVLWDERTDGPLPAVTLGGMVRSGDTLVFDQAHMDQRKASEQHAERAALLKQIDADTDAIYIAVQGYRGPEYLLAESDATAFKAAGYTGTVHSSVQSWATAKSQSAQWAADDILATAAGWRAAQAQIRAQRLARKEQARTAADLAPVAAAWAGFVAAIRAALGVA